MRMIESSPDACGGVEGVSPEMPFVGEGVFRFAGDGVRGRLVLGATAAIGGFLAGSEEADGESLSDKEAKALSKSLE
jgi:hypothetical protein